MRHFADSFSLFPPAQAVVAGLIQSCGEFAHLERARLPCVLSQRALVERGKAQPAVILGTDSEARSSARRQLLDWLLTAFVSSLCDWHEADALLVFDVALWPGRDDEQAQREHLVYHLLCHVQHKLGRYGEPKFADDGSPVLCLAGHDIERFESEVLRYGSTIEGIADERGIYAASRAREQAGR